MLNSTVALHGLVTSMSALNDQEAKIAQQISSGQRIASLSDDPAAAGQAVVLADSLRMEDAFTASAATVTNRMQAADTALSSVVSQLTSAISTATGALSGTGNATDRASSLQVLTSVRDSLFSMANSSYGGSYLFAGSTYAVAGAFPNPPFSMDASGVVTYTGTSATTSLTTPTGSKVTTSVLGSNVFTAPGADMFAALNSIITALQSPSGTSAADAATLVSNLTSSLTSVTTQRAGLNTAQARLSSESDFASQNETTLKAQQSHLLSADTAQLATELSAVTAQRSALLSTIAAVQKGSLFDYL